MHLTADLINSSLDYTNALKERELLLRGHKIPTIENLGPAKDYECLDFTDNDITILTNFPQCPRLQTLLCGRNRISKIAPAVARSLPKLTTLVLTQNQVSELADLEALKGMNKLVHLSLVDNPVQSKENYRYFILHLCPSIRFLDFQKVKDSERDRAEELFGTHDAPSELAQSIMTTRSNGAAPLTNGTAKAGSKLKFTPSEKLRYEKLVQNAKSLAEITRLEKTVQEGRMPPGVADSEAMDET